MNSRIVSVFFLSAIFSASAQGAASGRCTYEGKPLVFVDAYSAMAPDPFEDTKKVPMLWLTTKPLDHAKLAGSKAKDLDSAVMDQVFELESARIELRLDSTGKLVEGLNLYVPPGNNRSVSSNEVGKLTLKNANVAKMAGRWVLTDDDDLKCDLSFDVAMAGKAVAGKPAPAAAPAAAAKAWGTALPAGGGEPGKVYMAMHKATLAGDADTMISLATKSRGDEMRKARKDPDFPKMLQMIKLFEPAEVHVVSGKADATHAELQIAGKDADGAKMTGTVTLVIEGGAWKIQEVNSQSGGK